MRYLHSCTHSDDASVQCIGESLLVTSRVEIATPYFSPDVNECLTDNGNCSHICVNDMPGYHCDCSSGDVLHPNRLTCVPSANCSGDLETFACECLPGYEDVTSEENFNCSGR